MGGRGSGWVPPSSFVEFAIGQSTSGNTASAMCLRKVYVPLVTPVLRSRFVPPAARLIAFLILAVPALSISIARAAPALTAVQAGSASVIQVTLEQGLLTVDVRDAPLADLLRVIGERTGLRVTIHGNVKTLVTDSFTGLPLGEGIRRVVGRNGLVLIYAPSQGVAEANTLTEVRVYAKEPARMARPADEVYQALAHSDPSIRRGAVSKLAGRREEAATAALARSLARDEDPTIRGQAAAALGSTGGAEAAAALSTALLDRDPSVRIEVARALGRLEDEGGVQALRGVLIGDPDPRLRLEAVRALFLLRGQEARQALEAATADSDAVVRKSVAIALTLWENRPVAPSEGETADLPE